MTDAAPTNPLAFFCEAYDDPETSEIVFASSDVIARRRFAKFQGCEFEDVKTKRKPHFDKYAPGPVPLEALLEDGWYAHCASCGRRIDYTDDDLWIDNASVADLKGIAEHNAQVAEELAAFDRQQAATSQSENSSTKDTAAQPTHGVSPYARGYIASKSVDPCLDTKALRFIGNDVFCNAACQQDLYAQEATVNLAHALAEQEATRRFPEGRGFESKRYPYLEPEVTFTVEGLQFPVKWRPDEPNHVRLSLADKDAWEAVVSRRKSVEETVDGASQN